MAAYKTRLTKLFSILMITLIIFTALRDASIYTNAQLSSRISVAIIPPIYAVLLSIAAGDLVSIVNPIPPGVDPHTYEGTPQDIQRALQSDLVVVDVIGHLPIASKLVEAAKSSGKPYIVLFDELISRGWKPLKKPSGTDNVHIEFSSEAQILVLKIIRDKILEIARERYDKTSYDVFSYSLNNSVNELIDIINSTTSYAKTIASGLSGVAIYSSVSQYLLYSIGVEPVYVLTEEPEVEPTPQALQNLKNSGAKCVLFLKGVEEYSDTVISFLKSEGITPVFVNPREMIMLRVPYLVPLVAAITLKNSCSGEISEKTSPITSSLGSQQLYMNYVNTIIYASVIAIVLVLISYYFVRRRGRR